MRGGILILAPTHHLVAGVDAGHHWLQALDELGLVVGGHVAAVAGPDGVGEVGEGCEPVNEMVGHVEELELVGRGGECGAHDEVHLDRGEHGAQGVELGPQLPVSVGVVSVQVGQQTVVRLLDGLVHQVVGGHDPPPLVVHVPPELLQQGPEQDHSVPQRVLQLLDRLKCHFITETSPLQTSSYHESSLQLLGALVVGGVQVDAVEPGVHAGVAETLDTQHRLLGGAEHRERLVVKLALPVELLGLPGHVYDVVLGEHLGPVGLVPAGPAESLAWGETRQY